MASFAPLFLQTVLPASSLLASGSVGPVLFPATDLTAFDYVSGSLSSLGAILPTLQYRPFLILATSLLLLAVALPVSAGRPSLLLRWTGGRLLLSRLASDSVVFRRSARSLNEVLVAGQDLVFSRLGRITRSFLLSLFLLGVGERLLLLPVRAREFPILLVFFHLGAIIALRQSDRRELFLAVERTTLAGYSLVALARTNRWSTRAGVQYFLLGAVPSTTLVLSFALFYLHGGALTLADLDLLGTPVSTLRVGLAGLSAWTPFLRGDFRQFTTVTKAPAEFSRIGGETLPVSFTSARPFPVDLEAVLTVVNPLTPLTALASILLLLPLLFKRSAAPVQSWAPAVYGAAPTPAVTILAPYGKRRSLLLLLKLLRTLLAPFASVLQPVLFAVAGLSLRVARGGAFAERAVKRFFLFTSRGHVGFRIAGLAIGTIEGATAAVHYLAVYALSSLALWFLLLERGRGAPQLTSLARLRIDNPLYARSRRLILFSRSGLPPLGGFAVKLDVRAALLATGHSFVAYALFLATVASFFYYLRAVKILFFDRAPVELTSGIHNGLVGRLPTSAPRRQFITALLVFFLAIYLVLVDTAAIGIISERLGVLNLNFL